MSFCFIWPHDNKTPLQQTTSFLSEKVIINRSSSKTTPPMHQKIIVAYNIHIQHLIDGQVVIGERNRRNNVKRKQRWWIQIPPRCKKDPKLYYIVIQFCFVKLINWKASGLGVSQWSLQSKSIANVHRTVRRNRIRATNRWAEHCHNRAPDHSIQ